MWRCEDYDKTGYEGYSGMTGKLIFLDLGDSSRVPPLNTSLSFTLFCMVLCICFKF